MKTRSTVPILACLVLLSVATRPLTAQASTEEIDSTVWEVVSRTVAYHDLEGMAKTYHPDGVLVSGRGTVAIADQLAKWGQGMEALKAARASASVSFRFETRLDGESTAFEVGMFNYTEIDSNGNASPVYVPFEALLVKKDGRWLILMERQLEPTDEDAWRAMAQE